MAQENVSIPTSSSAPAVASTSSSPSTTNTSTPSTTSAPSSSTSSTPSSSTTNASNTQNTSSAESNKKTLQPKDNVQSGQDNQDTGSWHKRAQIVGGAAQGALEGYVSSAGSGSSGSANGAGASASGVSEAAKNGSGAANGNIAGQIAGSAGAVKSLVQNTFNGNLERGAIKKVVNVAKHPLDPALGLDKEDAKNVAKGVVQYFSGNYGGLVQTAVTEANHISEDGKKSDKDDSEKDNKFIEDSPDKSTQDNSESKKSKKQKEKEQEEKDNGEFAKDLLKTQAVASVGVQAYLAAQIALMFKAMMAMFANAIHAITSAISSVIASAVHMLATIAVSLSIPLTAATGGLFGVIAIGSVSVFGMVSSADDTASARTGDVDDEDPCVITEREFTMVDFDGDVLATEQQIYSFYSQYGFSDEQIAGLIGCWLAESGNSLDFTSVEAIFDEPFAIGERKAAALADMDAYMDVLVEHYKSSGWSIASSSDGRYSSYTGDGSHGTINTNGYRATDGLYYPGIGFGGFTAERARQLLLLGQNTEGYEWYSTELQLAYTISTDSKAQWMADWVGVSYGNPADACKDFANGSFGLTSDGTGWEGHAPDGDRIQNAEQVYLSIGEGWSTDEDFYNTIIDIAGDAAILSGNNAATTDRDAGCAEGVYTYGDSLADRMSAYCMDSKEEALEDYNNNVSMSSNPPEGVVCGSDLYIQVHQNIEALRGADNYYASCDRGVGYAILWAGVDDCVVFTGVSTLKTHLDTCVHWEEVTDSVSTEADLLPGDILLYTNDDGNHVVMYLGTDVVEKYHPDAEEGWVYGSASLGERGPSIGSESLDSYEHIYRNVQLESDPLYTDAAN